MARRASVSDWVSRHTGVAIGGFLSVIFLLVGLAGTLAFLPATRDWIAAADWPTTEAEIIGSDILYSKRGRTSRPEFTYRYRWQGQEYTTQGYDLLRVYVSGNSASLQAVKTTFPVGSRAPVLVNPERPSQAVLARGTAPGLIIFAIPPFFALLGLIGGVFTTAAWLGWLDEKSRHPFGRIVWAFGRWFLRESILKPFFFLIIGAVVVGFTVIGVRSENWLIVAVAAFVAWGVWQASRKRRR